MGSVSNQRAVTRNLSRLGGHLAGGRWGSLDPYARSPRSQALNVTELHCLVHRRQALLRHGERQRLELLRGQIVFTPEFHHPKPAPVGGPFTLPSVRGANSQDRGGTSVVSDQ